MEVISLYRFKKMGFSLQELGFPSPLDETTANDLIYLENCINDKQQKDFNK